MGDFLLIAADGDGAAAALSSELADRAARDGFSVSDLNRRAWLAVRGPHAPRRQAIGAWTLIGDVFDRRSPVLPAVASDDPLAYERKLMARIWGRYVGLRFGARDRLDAVMRDPSGAMECVTWSDQGLTVVCSSVQDWLLRRLRPRWRIDPERVAWALHQPVPATGALLLHGPTALEPGALQPLPLDRPARTLWKPSDFARLSLGRAPSADAAADHLRSAIDEAAAGLGRLPGPLAAEVSGGLDSGIVASSLVAAGCDVGLWLNAYGATPESDERLYVDALAETLGIRPTSVPHRAEPVTGDWLEKLSTDFRPGLNALDRAHDLDWAGRLAGAGFTALMTGKGGDSALLNRATSDVFIDRWMAGRWSALRSPDTAELATSNEISIWTLIARARVHARTGAAIPRRDHPMLPTPAGVPPIHPWLADWSEFGPAKALHIAGLADNVARHGPSALTAVVDVRNPLCAQPVIETCLALPAALLTVGGRERGLARRAFSDRLPARIIDRRSKGDMTKIYGRMIHDSLGVLRPWLIEGRLAAMGVLDPVEADRHLTREALVWRGKYSAIMVAAAFESWVRAWERRLQPG